MPRNPLSGASPFAGNDGDAFGDWAVCKLYTTDGSTPEGFTFKEWALQADGSLALVDGGLFNSTSDLAYFIDSTATWTIDDPLTDPPVLVRRASKNDAGGTRWEVAKLGGANAAGFFARLTTASGGLWKYYKLTLDGSGGFVDDGSESAGFTASPLKIDGTSLCNPVAGLRVWMVESKAAGRQEFLPFGYADNAGAGYFPGLVSTANQRWKGQKTVDNVVGSDTVSVRIGVADRYPFSPTSDRGAGIYFEEVDGGGNTFYVNTVATKATDIGYLIAPRYLTSAFVDSPTRVAVQYKAGTISLVPPIPTYTGFEGGYAVVDETGASDLGYWGLVGVGAQSLGGIVTTQGTIGVDAGPLSLGGLTLTFVRGVLTFQSGTFTAGTVTSIAASGGTTGLSFTGSPVTTSGTLTLGGTLNVANGGSGLASATTNGILFGNGTGAMGVTAAGTAGQLLIWGSPPGPVSMSGDATITSAGVLTIANNAVTTAKINNAAVTLAKVANAAANDKLLGSGNSGSGASYVEITLGTGLTMTGTTLSASGGSGSPGGASGDVQLNDGAGGFTGTSGFTVATGTVFVTGAANSDGLMSFASTGSVYNVEICSSSNAMNMSDTSSNLVVVCDQTNAGYFQSGAGRAATLANASRAGRFTDGTRTVDLCDGTNNVTYTPANSSDWNGSPPTDVWAALDRCAALLKTLNGGTGP